MKATSNATPVILRRIMWLALSLMAMAALALTTQLAQAGEQVPFTASFTTEFESSVVLQVAQITSSARVKGSIWAMPQQLLLTNWSISSPENRLRPTR